VEWRVQAEWEEVLHTNIEEAQCIIGEISIRRYCHHHQYTETRLAQQITCSANSISKQCITYALHRLDMLAQSLWIYYSTDHITQRNETIELRC